MQATQPARDSANRREVPKLKFTGSGEFHQTLRARVDEFFRSTGKRPRDCWQMYLKTAIIAAWFGVTYALLVFWADAWWEAVPLAVSLALATGAIGFNIQHDGGHRAYSDRQWVNSAMAMSLDLVGGSSYIWRWKHSVFHHTYTNIQAYDADMDLGAVARLAPYQKLRFWQRWQHWYIWLMYGIMTIRWQLWGDFRDLIAGDAGTLKFPRPRGWALVSLIAGKLVFLTLAFAIPLMFHSIWVVLGFYALSMGITGLLLAVVFQLAHCVEEAEFQPEPDAAGEVHNAWAIHQIESTVNFARRSRVLSWFVGGLNFQIEHHLFPRVCHIHYPALSRVVEATCREFDVDYREHGSFWSGVASHFRWLRRMSRDQQGTAQA